VEQSSEQTNVIVLGASPERWRFANKAVRCYRELGYTVFAVHPTASVVKESTPFRASRWWRRRPRCC
jgi:hypothetical protein